nr:FAD-dependent oxidoreductase [Bacillus subtilis]
MKIGIIGGGSVGLLCAYYLSLYHDVTVVTRRQEQAAVPFSLKESGFIKAGRNSGLIAVRTRVSIRTLTCLS